MAGAAPGATPQPGAELGGLGREVPSWEVPDREQGGSAQGAQQGGS